PNSSRYRGISVGGPQTATSAPSFCRQKMLLRATRLWEMSPKMQTRRPLKLLNRSRMEYASSKAWVGCSWVPSPALMMLASMWRDRNSGVPTTEWRTTTISTFIDRIFLTVSRRVSPFLTLDPPDEKLRTSAESRFSASSKEIRVRVEFSKNKLAIVMSRNV